MTSQNPFPKPSALQRYYLKQLTDFAAKASNNGWCPATAGNFSIRGNGNLFWQSPSGVDKSALQARAFIPIDGKSFEPVNPLSRKPSDETPVHGRIYQLFPEVNSVFHVHPPNLIKRLTQNLPLIFEGQEILKAFGFKSHLDRLEIPILANSQDMHGLASNLELSQLQSAPLLVLDGHGVYSWGINASKAFTYIEALEFLCNQ